MKMSKKDNFVKMLRTTAQVVLWGDSLESKLGGLPSICRGL